MSIQCPKCGYENTNENSLFCLSCAALIGGAEFKEQKELETYASKAQKFLSELEKANSSLNVVAPVKELEKTFKDASEVQNFLEIYAQNVPEDKEIKKYSDEMRKFLQRDNSFQIAFVGTVNAGKSTLINAMLRKDYASVSVTPETAVLSKFRYGKEAKLTISFYNAKEWDELWASASKSGGLFKEQYDKHNAESFKNEYVGKKSIKLDLSKEELEKHTSSKSAAHYFVKEVEIEFPEFPYEKNIVFVDTPGLDDAVDYRSKVTRDYINRADAVLVCVDSSVLPKNMVDTILRIFDHTGGKPEKVYVLGTKYENLNNPLKDWEAQKIEWSKYLSSNASNEKTKYTKELAQKNIIPTSGHTALLCELFKQNKLNEEQKQELENVCFKVCRSAEIASNLQKLEDFSNVFNVHKRIEEDILNKVQEGIIEGAKTSYKILNKEITDYFKKSLKDLSQNYEASKKGIEAVNARIKEQEKSLEELEKSKEQLDGVLKEFEAESNKMLKELNAELEKVINDK